MAGADFVGTTPMTIHTVSSLRAKRHRFETRLEKAEIVLAAMRHGCSLHLEYRKQGPRWALSNGREVPDNVAKLVIASSSVVGVGDALFEGAPSQTFRWWRE
jgi:hypothetical protein